MGIRFLKGREGGIYRYQWRQMHQWQAQCCWEHRGGGGGCGVGQGVRIVCGQISLWRILLTNGKKILRSWTNSTKRSGKQNIIKWKSLQDALSKWPSQLYWQNAGKQLVEVLQMHTAFASTVQLFSYPIEFLICDIRGPRDGIEY